MNYAVAWVSDYIRVVLLSYCNVFCGDVFIKYGFFCVETKNTFSFGKCLIIWEFTKTLLCYGLFYQQTGKETCGTIDIFHFLYSEIKHDVLLVLIRPSNYSSFEPVNKLFVLYFPLLTILTANPVCSWLISCWLLSFEHCWNRHLWQCSKLNICCSQYYGGYNGFCVLILPVDISAEMDQPIISWVGAGGGRGGASCFTNL
jgi:hypothetical protein